MRFEARWSNGYWKLFDTFMYCGREMFATQADAEKAAEAANRDSARSR